MTMVRRCDGCHAQISDRHDYVTVERHDPLVSEYIPGLPREGESFHWCRSCAVRAAAALDGSGS